MLQVHLGDVHVGTLELISNKTVFRFADSYLGMEDRPTLGRWFEDHLTGELELVGIHSRVPNFFQNYLPEPGSVLRRLVARDAGVPEHREFALLARLGADLPGNIRVVGEMAPMMADTGHADGSRSAVEGRPLRFSLAGVQLKFSVARAGDRFTIPASGQDGKWILKLPDPANPELPSNEAAMLRWARVSGIDVPENSLVSVDDFEGIPASYRFQERVALAIRRFDREASGVRIHQEDFAQVLGVSPEEKYEHANYATIAKIVHAATGKEDYAKVLRRLVFAVVSGNGDAHLKNWSLVYPNGRRPRLSPAYDLVSTVAYPDYEKTLALKLGGEKDFYRLRRTHFARLAEKAGLDVDLSMSLVEQALQSIKDAWASEGIASSLPSDQAKRLSLHVETVLKQLS